MQIIKDNETLDLGKDPSLEIDNSSPIFSNKGSMSVPVTFPKSPKNQRLLGFPGRTDRNHKIINDQKVTVLDGPIMRHGVMNIISGEIEANIGFDEGEAYAKMSEVKLADMDGLPVYAPEGDDTVSAVIAHLTAVMKGEVSTDYCVFPTITTLEENTDTGKAEYYMALNEMGDVNGTEALLGSAARKMKVKIDNELAEIDMPAGYGISPFIRLHVLLDLIWKYLGYTLVENPFAQHPQLKQLCILNNTYDTIVTGKIDYKHLMPDCTIEDVLDMIWGRFGARYFVDSNTLTVRIKLIKDILDSHVCSDYSSFKSAPATISITEQKQLKFMINRSGDKMNTDTDTYEEYIEKCNGIITEVPHTHLNSSEHPYNKYVNILDTVTGNYYCRSPFTQKLSLVSSSFFDWDRKEKDLEYEEIKSPDTQVAMVADVLDGCPAPYLESGEYHVNTSLRLDRDADDNTEEKCGLTLCFSLGSSNLGTLERYFGSVFGRYADGTGYFTWVGDDGEETEYFDLLYHGTHGLVHLFWEGYIDFMHHANQETTLNFNLSPIQLSSFDFSKKIYIDGQRYLPESFKQVLGKSTNEPVELKLRSLRLLKPYDLEKEHKIPTSEEQRYYWLLSDNHDVAIQDYADFLKQEYDATRVDWLGYYKFTKDPKSFSSLLRNAPESEEDYIMFDRNFPLTTGYIIRYPGGSADIQLEAELTCKVFALALEIVL